MKYEKPLVIRSFRNNEVFGSTEANALLASAWSKTCSWTNWNNQGHPMPQQPTVNIW